MSDNIVLQNKKSAYLKEYQIRNKEKIKLQRKDYREKNKNQISEKRKQWYLENKEYVKEHAKTYRQEHYEIVHKQESKRLPDKRRQRRELRERVLAVYGNKCECCGVSNYEFLAMDHIGGGGNAHRKETGHMNIYKWIEKNNYPKMFRILCHNCNMAIGFYGHCPHAVKK